MPKVLIVDDDRAQFLLIQNFLDGEILDNTNSIKENTTRIRSAGNLLRMVLRSVTIPNSVR